MLEIGQFDGSILGSAPRELTLKLVREHIAQNGYRLAIENHTWFKRAETLCKMLLYQL